MTIFGVERTQVGFIGLMVMTIWLAFHAFFGSVALGAVMFVAARFATAREPKMLEMLARAKHGRKRYDPAKHEPLDVGVR